MVHVELHTPHKWSTATDTSKWETTKKNKRAKIQGCASGFIPTAIHAILVVICSVRVILVRMPTNASRSLRRAR